MAKTPGRGPRGQRNSYGIGEWYGRLYASLGQAGRLEFVNLPKYSPIECRFMADMPDLAPRGRILCNKPGGVCSLRSFAAEPDGRISFGPVTATCPNRFLEGGTVFKEIARVLLGTEAASIVKEIPFLIRPQNGVAAEAGAEPELGLDAAGDNEDVGRIDMVMVHPEARPLHWCAVELQAVYFSGGAMSKDFDVIRRHGGDDAPMPGANRRPDFRSCGPKRLMPQLQTKVPTLRRWGRKMAVVVDRPFFDSLGPMDRVPHVSNSDIIWFIVRFDESQSGDRAVLAVDEIRYTTLERAVEGLTAGIPTSIDDFETKIRHKLG